MTMLLRDREAVPEPETPLPAAESEQPEPVRSLPCEACGAAMRADQDWCLACGTAAPGRLGARPGWRAAFTVVGLTLLLLIAAVAASYAALTGDAQREASRPSAGAGEPIVAQTPGVGQSAAPVAPGATGPGTAPPRPPAVARAPAIGAPRPGQGAAGAPQKSGAGKSSSSSSSSAGAQRASAPAAPPQPVTLSGSAATYDPAKRAGAEFGPAGSAVDGSRSTVWDVTVPADGAPVGAGLVIDLGAAYSLRSLTIGTPTPGFSVELYGAKGTVIPPDILDGRWVNMAASGGVSDGASIGLNARGKVRFVNLWFTRAADAQDPRIAIASVSVNATK